MTTDKMIKLLALHGSEIVRYKCRAILDGKTTIEHERKYCGGFLTAVFDGDFHLALTRADATNYNALILDQDD